MPRTIPTRLIVMGVTSTGKSRVGARLAAVLGLPFLDGDDLHPANNRAKMAAGIPLDDIDRRPWLNRIGAALAGRPRVVACSALRRRYRDRIRAAAPNVLFVHLQGPQTVIAERMARREGHFMPVSLLDSQLATLEPLQVDERALHLDIRRSPERIVADALDALRRPVR